MHIRNLVRGFVVFVLISSLTVTISLLFSSLFIKPDRITPSVEEPYVLKPEIKQNFTHVLIKPLKVIVHKRHKMDTINAIMNDVRNHGGYIENYEYGKRNSGVNMVIPLSYLDRLKILNEYPDAWIHPTYMDWVEATRQTPDPVATEGPLTSVSIKVSSVRVQERWMADAVPVCFVIFLVSVFVMILISYPNRSRNS